MDSPVNNKKDKLASTFTLFKMAFYLASNKNKSQDYAVAFILPAVIYFILCLFSFIIIIISPDLKPLMFLLPVPFILPLLLVAFLGILNGFNHQRKVSYDEIIIQGFKLLFPFLWLALLNILIVIIGLCLFIIPGIFWGIRYSLSIGVLVFEGEKGFQALSKSKSLTQQHFFYLFLNYGACAAVIMLAFLVALFFPAVGTVFDILRLFIIISAGIFALAFYYCMFKQLHSRHQLAVGVSSLEVADSGSKLEQNISPFEITDNSNNGAHIQTEKTRDV